MAWAKEATVIILDIGSNMKEPTEEGAKLTALEVSVECVTRMLQNKLFTDSKDEFALVLLGADSTDNRLNELSEESYTNITTESGLKLVDWSILDSLGKINQPTDVQGDVFEGLKLAVDIIEQEEAASKKKRFAKRRVILFSNLHGIFHASDSQITGFAKNAQTCGINMLQLIGVDLEEAKRANSTHAKQAKKSKSGKSPASSVDALFASLESLALESVESYSFRDAMKYTNYFTSRQVRPTPWNGVLEVGASLKIPVVMYARVKEAKPKQNWKKAYAADPSVGIQQSTEFIVQRGLEREVISETEVVEGYRYGVTLVPFTDRDKAEMKFAGIGKCLKVLGFALATQVKQHLYVGDDVKILTAPLADDVAQTAVSALVHALKDENMVVICKFGYNKSSAPKMLCLSPHLCEREDGPYEGLFVHQLPFEDDLRLYTFAPITDPKIKPLIQPNDEQLDAVGDLIDQLTIAPEDGYFEALNPKNVRNPYLQRLYHSLQHRALHPDDPLPPVDQNLLANLNMPAELAKRSDAAREKVKFLFPLKKMEKKKFHKNFAADGAVEAGAVGEEQVDTALVGLNITGAENVISAIGTISPVDDFIALTSGADENKFNDAVRKGIDVVHQLIFSFDGEVYADKVLRLIAVMREHCLSRKTATICNMFLKAFKAELLEKKLNSVWKKMVERNITLIHQEECQNSSVTKVEANEFLRTAALETINSKTNGTKKDEDDMFEEMFN